MLHVLARNWWLLVVRGVLSVLFGLAAFIWPGPTLLALVLLFGAYALVDGIFAIVAAITGAERGTRWWALVLEGIVGILAAAAVVLWPGISVLALLYLIAAWAILTGVFEIAAAIRLRKEIEGEWVLALGGVASVLFGILVAVSPGAGALAVAWLIGGYAFVFGLLLIVLGMRLRSAAQPAVTTGRAAGSAA